MATALATDAVLFGAVGGPKWDDVPRQFARWVFAGGRMLPGLVRWRAAEAALWEGMD